ncbi:MAG: polyprenyl synthetase [Sphingobacteriales bacterium SCN 48-20]|jgi:octaprenyl-diphosphate synthase|uniref:polyprenyl synthetase family protein n=1 Tax=Terrimonas ferruginea TaxID=249 RepID=UPI00048F81A3|nr:polyprenyl synthetase family protein [Terrimonas ferruginea]MBN8781676.1 polyprenyl synthetase family protein [Terrimonas ferruginea]ODT93210.1 MAG: polyprenyl synthetase [Sphingobacteriales bacterium SCN 48-20]OJW44832.1 MAG: polyprenyl synthetase [Sphingobacteriales bacterium 48-107]
MDLPVALIEAELKEFETRFREAVKSQTPMLDRIMRYIVKRKGKQLRPMFVLLSARLSGPVNDSTYRAASMVEVLHTATLVHDDVVDDSAERRGFFSVYALWKNKISVLVGDYLLAKGLILSLEKNDYRILHILTDAVRQISEGELLQMEKARSLNLREDIYYEIIRSKTASLLASACSAGAWSVSQDEEVTEKMRLFGEYTGMAFQIKDDLFDYASENVGKPTGNDIKEKKLTLPLIYTLNRADKETRRKIIYIVKNNNRDRQKVNWVINEVEKAGGIDYAIAKMNEYKQAALDILHTFPESPYRQGLEDLVRYVTERKY